MIDQNNQQKDVIKNLPAVLTTGRDLVPYIRHLPVVISAGRSLVPFLPAVIYLPAPVRADDKDDDDLGNDNDGQEDRKTGVLLKTRPKTKKPSMYKVLLLNDDYTPMEFVVLVLEKFFGKSKQEATDIMLHVHRKGVGICGVYTFEVAETKVSQVMDFARSHEQPLQCTMEKD